MAKPGLLLTSTFALVLTCLTLATLAAEPTTAISCTTVSLQLAPCLSFIIDKADKPSSQCCSGAKQIAEMAKTKEDRQGVCECIKKTTGSLTNVDYAKIPQITKTCGIKISLPTINKDTNCKSIPLKDLIATED